MAFARWQSSAGGNAAAASSRAAAPSTAAQQAAVAELITAAEGLPAVRTRSTVAHFAGEPQAPSGAGNRLVAKPRPSIIQRVEGYRIIDVGFVDEALAPLLTCPHCCATGSLVCSREHEQSAGLSSLLVWVCSACSEEALRTHTSQPLPRKPEQKGPSLRQINAQLVTGAVHTGLGVESSRILSSILHVPPPNRKAWLKAAAVVYDAMEEGGRASAQAALVEERLEAFAAGVLPDAKGETPVVISIDARWPKRGRANNSLDGYMAAIAVAAM